MTNDWIHTYTQHKPHPNLSKPDTFAKWSTVSAAQSAGQSVEYLTCQLSWTMSISAFKSPKTEKNETFLNSLKINHTREKQAGEKTMQRDKEQMK